MTGVYAGLAALTVVLHLLFVAFAAAGGLLAVAWPKVKWIHLPSAAWAAYVELSGRLCPLTPLENYWRRQAGLDAYSGDFIATYILPVLYPEGLTRHAQLALGAAVITLNVAVYGWWLRRRPTPDA